MKNRFLENFQEKDIPLKLEGFDGKRRFKSNETLEPKDSIQDLNENIMDAGPNDYAKGDTKSILTSISSSQCKESGKYNKTHKDSTNSSKIRSFRCEECNQGFFHKHHLDTHKKAKHSNVHDWHCEQCDYSTYTKQN